MAVESTTHSFIVKVWLEETAQEAGEATWRGYITHVPGERRYLHDLDDVTGFIGIYLETMGLKLGWRWRLRRWLKRRWPHRSRPSSGS